MNHRGLIFCLALAVVASGALLTRYELKRRALRRGDAGGKPFRLGLVGKPRLDVSLTSDSVPL